MAAKSTGKISDVFSASQAAGLVGLSVDMVNYLCRNDIVIPTGGARRGRGVRRRYTFADVLVLRAVARLLEGGISVLRLKHSLVGLRQRSGTLPADILSRRYLVIDGHDVFIQDGGLLEILESGQTAFAFVLELENLRGEVRAAIERQAA